MYANLLKVLVRELAQQIEVDGVALEDLVVLPQSKSLEPLPDVLHPPPSGTASGN
jgi:hypothetical protein